MRRLDSKGFTLIELIATLVVLSIVMGLGAYSITGIIKSSKEKDYELLIKEIKNAAELYYQECNYSDDMLYSCHYDFNFDGKLTNDDATLMLNCINNGFDDNSCEYVSVFGDVDKNSVVNKDDSIALLYIIMYKDYPEYSHIYGPIEKNKYFTNLDKLVDLGYLKGNGKNEDDKNVLVNSKTKNYIGKCVVSVEYTDSKFKITNKGSIDNINQEDCPTDDDYSSY